MTNKPAPPRDERPGSSPPAPEMSPKNILPARVVSFIEMCGRHPFATGVFALLGIFGLLFSFLTFGIDQAQNQADSREVREVRESVQRVEQAVKEASPSAEPENFVPLASENAAINERIDNVAFKSTLIGRTFEWIVENDPESFSEYMGFAFSVRSIAEADFVQLAPYLVIDVSAVEPVPNDLAVIDRGERGEGAVIKEFRAAIVPREGYQFAPLYDGESGELKSDVDYFSLMPREPEEIFVDLYVSPGHIYTIRFGVPYRYKGRTGIYWLNNPVRTGVASGLVLVSNWDSEYQPGPHPYYWPGMAEFVSEQASENQRAVSRSTLFPPAALP